MSQRRSYSGLMRLPAWRLDDAEDGIIASVRAATAQEARELFRAHGLAGSRVRRADAPVSRWRTAPDGRRFKVYVGSCLCDPCWQARCECGTVLTKHDFDETGAVACALDSLARDDPRPGFGHALCSRTTTARG